MPTCYIINAEITHTHTHYLFIGVIICCSRADPGQILQCMGASDAAQKKDSRIVRSSISNHIHKSRRDAHCARVWQILSPLLLMCAHAKPLFIALCTLFDQIIYGFLEAFAPWKLQQKIYFPTFFRSKSLIAWPKWDGIIEKEENIIEEGIIHKRPKRNPKLKAHFFVPK